MIYNFLIQFKYFFLKNNHLSIFERAAVSQKATEEKDEFALGSAAEMETCL